MPQLSCSLLLFPLQLLCYPPLPAPHMLVCSSCRRTFVPALCAWFLLPGMVSPPLST